MIADLSAPRFLKGLLDFSAAASAFCSPSVGAASEDSEVISGAADSVEPAFISAGGSPRTFVTASANSGSTSVSVTSESPMGGRLAVPLKMQSDMRSARSILWLCSPRTQEIASTTLDLPQPLGPMMQVMPLPLKTILVFSQNDLKPNSSTLRSLSTLLLGKFPRAGRCAQNSIQTYSVESRVPRQKYGGSRSAGPAAWRFGEAVMKGKIACVAEACKAGEMQMCSESAWRTSGQFSAVRFTSGIVHTRR